VVTELADGGRRCQERCQGRRSGFDDRRVKALVSRAKLSDYERASSATSYTTQGRSLPHKTDLPTLISLLNTLNPESEHATNRKDLSARAGRRFKSLTSRNETPPTYSSGTASSQFSNWL
jgi:hypothetical protein